MARPPYPGAHFFPLHCHLDEKFDLIEAEYGLQGFAIVVKLYQKIYGELGYYCEWNRDVGLLFAQANCVGYNLVSEVVNACLRRGIFCKSMFDLHGILTSVGIQRRYLKMVERRVGQKILPEYALVECAQKPNMSTETPVSDNRNSENVDKNSLKRKEINNTTTTTNPIALSRAREESPPGEALFLFRIEIVEYFSHFSYIEDPGREAWRFIQYNEKRRWDCLPNWKEAADRWIEKIK